MLLINRTQLEQVLPMPDAVAIVEEGFREHQLGRSLTPLRMHVEVERMQGVYLLMPSFLEKAALFGTKLLSVYPQNRQQHKPTINSVYILNDAVDGSFIAMMDGFFLTGTRTGAASAVATNALARDDASVHGMIGCGGQAIFQAAAISTVRTIKKVLVYDHHENTALDFCRKAERMLGIPVEAMPSPRDVASRADILTTVTTSATPVVFLADIKPGCHINAVGAFKPTMQEIGSDLLKKALVVVDTDEGCLKESGDLIIPIEKGEYSKAQIHAELGEILLGTKNGRSDHQQLTLFESVGIAFEDLQAARLAYNMAREKRIGTEIRLTD